MREGEGERINQPEKAQVHCCALGLEKEKKINKKSILSGKGMLWEEIILQLGVTGTITSSVTFFVYLNQLQRISHLKKWFCRFSYP